MNIIFYNYNNSILDEIENKILINVFGYTSGILITPTKKKNETKPSYHL
jgi:hypothetical protein